MLKKILRVSLLAVLAVLFINTVPYNVYAECQALIKINESTESLKAGDTVTFDIFNDCAKNKQIDFQIVHGSGPMRSPVYNETLYADANGHASTTYTFPRKITSDNYQLYAISNPPDVTRDLPGSVRNIDVGGDSTFLAAFTAIILMGILIGWFMKRQSGTGR